jgi:vitamin B12 transporter
MIGSSFARGGQAAACRLSCLVVRARAWGAPGLSHPSVVGLVGLLGAAAVAAEPLTPAQQLDEVVVTATKIERPARYITDSVTVVTEEEIERQSFTDTTEILRQTAGVQFKQAGGPGQFNYPKLRGFGSGNFLVVVDGVKVNDGLDPGVGNVLGQIDPALIERIEVLRGPLADL